MTGDEFSWNPYADQPHNVAPKWARRRRHVRNIGDYFELAVENLSRTIPVLLRTRTLMRTVHTRPADIGTAFGCAVSEAGGRSGEVIALLRETGVRLTLVRLASWEPERMPRIEAFVRDLRAEGLEVCLSLLQRRRDVPAGGGRFWTRRWAASPLSAPASRSGTHGTGRNGVSGATKNMSPWPNRPSMRPRGLGRALSVPP